MQECLQRYGTQPKLVNLVMNHSEANKGNLPPTLAFTSEKEAHASQHEV